MSQLLILGNGFDLQCGLKSSYKDFFRCSILDTEQSDAPKMKQCCDGFWEQLLFNYYMKFGNDDYKWCDIESIINQTIWSINFGESDTSSPIPSEGIWGDALSCFERNYDPIEEAKKIKEPINKYLYTYCARFYFHNLPCSNEKADYEQHLLNAHLLQELKNFESRFCKYLKELIVDPSSEIVLNAEQKQHLLTVSILQDVQNLRCNYLKEFVVDPSSEIKFDKKYIVNASNLIAKLTDFTNERFENIEDVIKEAIEGQKKPISKKHFISSWTKINVLKEEFFKLNDISILSFNYTALFDILKVDAPWLYSNVHGKICLEKCSENCKSSSIIFGIDDTVIQSQKSNDELRIFSKTYRKMSNTGAPISILPPNNGKPLKIKFYGHSLSDADYSYFQSIFDYYNIYNNSNIELVFYYSKGFEQTDAIYRLLNTYGTTFMNQQQGKNLIHKLLLENRLKIIEISLHS